VNGLHEVVILAAVRTPMGRYGGALAAVRPDDLAAHAIAGAVGRVPGLTPTDLDEIVLGATNQAGEDNRNVARMAALLAGLPEVPGYTVNRLCGSGLQAVNDAAARIALGAAEIAVAGGVESMSRAPYVVPKQATAFGRAGDLRHDDRLAHGQPSDAGRAHDLDGPGRGAPRRRLRDRSGGAGHVRAALARAGPRRRRSR
jgi:acetyl-CoA acyltransferase